jgi:hypothetical protein
VSLRGAIVPLARLSGADRDAMFALFERYYDDVDRARFDADLRAKDAVILLRDAAGAVRGFSTCRTFEVRVEGRLHRGLFSGDTVVDEPFWGTKVLGRLFLRHLFWLRLRHPLTPLWWFLISKGYKTYLLMANNFPEHWPRHERPTPPARQALLDAFGQAAFPDAYDPATGLVRWPGPAGRLRDGVAVATEALRSAEPRVRFFVARNPEWAAGVELACVARMRLDMPVRYALKALRDRLAAPRRRAAATREAA